MAGEYHDCLSSDSDSGITNESIVTTRRGMIYCYSQHLSSLIQLMAIACHVTSVYTWKWMNKMYSYKSPKKPRRTLLGSYYQVIYSPQQMNSRTIKTSNHKCFSSVWICPSMSRHQYRGTVCTMQYRVTHDSHLENLSTSSTWQN